MSADVGRLLAALADETRRGIVDRLADGDTPTATELARDLPMSRQAVTKHLQLLADAGLVTSRREGRETRYELRPGPLDAADAWLARVRATWTERLERLKVQAEAEAGATSQRTASTAGNGNDATGAGRANRHP